MEKSNIFIWLTNKYPSIIAPFIEQTTSNESIYIDSSEPNPNDVEFDNLYVAMNRIIYRCSQLIGNSAPHNEDKMMIKIFEHISKLFKIVKPRKLLYMAIDGVAPRIKMNQQRLKCFRAAQERSAKLEDLRRDREELLEKGVPLRPESNLEEEYFDSNCLNPGTHFMARLSIYLHHYIHYKMNNDPSWKTIKVILSDANVPGEGEHKIMDFIRKQRTQPDHDPNTRHCVCGFYANIIMLGLATHEVNFTIISEESKLNKTKPCECCGQAGHDFTDCLGGKSAAKHKAVPFLSKQKFIFIKLNVLREHLKQELQIPNVPFKYDFERALDDWIFMCLVVSNDFLPKLPSLEIREGAIDRLVNLYKQCVYQIKGYITNNGDVNLEGLQMIMMELGKSEDFIFLRRYKNQQNLRIQTVRNWHERKRTFKQTEAEKNKESHDEVRLWEDGFKDRYYKSKFDATSDDMLFRNLVALQYVRGLCWVLQYYYQGCPSWKWYFPYRYAPFASDFMIIVGLNTKFDNGTKPFKPLEQLMGILPASSHSHLPKDWADLMVNPNSPIIDFYPNDFKIDLNGKRFVWLGVILLPFVDESRLLKALTKVYHHLTPPEKERNSLGDKLLYVGVNHKDYNRLRELYNLKTDPNSETAISIDEIRGNVLLSRKMVEHGEVLEAPIKSLQTIENNQVCCVNYRCSTYLDGFILPNTKLELDNFLLGKVVKSEDFKQQEDNDNHKPNIAMPFSNSNKTTYTVGYGMLNHHNDGNNYNVPPLRYENQLEHNRDNTQSDSVCTIGYNNRDGRGCIINNMENIIETQQNVIRHFHSMATVGSFRQDMLNHFGVAPIQLNIPPLGYENFFVGQNGNHQVNSYQDGSRSGQHRYAQSVNQNNSFNNRGGYNTEQNTNNSMYRGRGRIYNQDAYNSGNGPMAHKK